MVNISIEKQFQIFILANIILRKANVHNCDIEQNMNMKGKGTSLFSRIILNVTKVTGIIVDQKFRIPNFLGFFDDLFGSLIVGSLHLKRKRITTLPILHKNQPKPLRIMLKVGESQNKYSIVEGSRLWSFKTIF